MALYDQLREYMKNKTTTTGNIQDFKNYVKTKPATNAIGSGINTGQKDSKPSISEVAGYVDQAHKAIQADKPPVVSVNNASNGSDGYLTNLQNYVNSMYNNQYKSLMDKYIANRDKAVGQLNQEKATIAPQYQNKRNQADVGYNQNVQRLREVMAANGLGASGENVSAQTNLAGARQGALNELNLQEQQTTNDINRRISDLYNPNDLNSMTANVEFQRAQSLLNAYQNAVARGDRLAQQDIENEFNKAGMTGMLNGTPTLAMQQFNWNTNPNNPAYQSQQLANDMAQLQLGAMPQQIRDQASLIQQQLSQGQINLDTARFNLQQLQDPNSPINMKNQLELEMAQLQSQYMEPQLKLQLEQLQKQIEQIGKAPYRSPQEVESDKLKVELLKSQLDQLNSPAQPQTNNEISARDSATNYFNAKQQLKQAQNAEEAKQYVDKYIAPYVNDSDYRKLLDYIISNF